MKQLTKTQVDEQFIKSMDEALAEMEAAKNEGTGLEKAARMLTYGLAYDMREEVRKGTHVWDLKIFGGTEGETPKVVVEPAG